MGILSKIFGNASAKPVEAVGGLLDDLFTSDEERLTLDVAKTRLMQRPGLAYNAILQAEASHRSAWVAGWRPFIGYVLGISLALYFVPQYAVAAYVWWLAMSANEFTEMLPYPVSGDDLLELVAGMIGLATLRGIDKWFGRAK